MTDATQAPADVFEVEASVRILKNGKPWTRQLTESMQMDQTNAVICQHVLVESIKAPLLKMGIASASVKDPEFEKRYGEIMALLAA